MSTLPIGQPPVSPTQTTQQPQANGFMAALQTVQQLSRIASNGVPGGIAGAAVLTFALGSLVGNRNQAQPAGGEGQTAPTNGETPTV